MESEAAMCSAISSVNKAPFLGRGSACSDEQDLGIAFIECSAKDATNVEVSHSHGSDTELLRGFVIWTLFGPLG